LRPCVSFVATLTIFAAVMATRMLTSLHVCALPSSAAVMVMVVMLHPGTGLREAAARRLRMRRRAHDGEYSRQTNSPDQRTLFHGYDSSL
jgi:hypothetical protein